MSVFSTAASKVVNLLGITAKGQATMANSLPVVVASDQNLTVTTGAKNALIFSEQKNAIESSDPLPLPATPTAQRNTLILQNVHASGNLFISTDDEMTTASGYKLVPGASVTLQASATTVIYGISDAVSNAMDVRIIEAV
jgi:hypothetical protein